nr:MAG TPA: hypothetical protein [Caudoviricetes sp.]DAP77570.1 MAG TPA: hypothetical protein [Caudoviricetes sp.]
MIDKIKRYLEYKYYLRKARNIIKQMNKKSL